MEYGLSAFFGKDIIQIGFALVSVAAIALLVSHAKGTAEIVQASGNTFEGLLRTVTLQSGYNNAFNAI